MTEEKEILFSQNSQHPKNSGYLRFIFSASKQAGLRKKEQRKGKKKSVCKFLGNRREITAATTRFRRVWGKFTKMDLWRGLKTGS